MILTLKQMSVLLIVSMFLSSAIVWGLKATTAVEETVGRGIMVKASHFPLKLTMLLNKTTFEVGELVNITLFLENIGNETLDIHYRVIDYFSFIVYDKNGSKVYEPDPVWLALYTPKVPLPPGLAQIAVIPWHQPYDLKPNAYQIAGLFISHTLNFTIETMPVTIKIT